MAISSSSGGSMLPRTPRAPAARPGDAGPLFELYGTEKLTPAQVLTTSMILQGVPRRLRRCRLTRCRWIRRRCRARTCVVRPVRVGRGSRVAARAGHRSRDQHLRRLWPRADFTGDGQEDTVRVGTTATGTVPDRHRASRNPPRSIRTGMALPTGGRRSCSRTASAAARSRRSTSTPTERASSRSSCKKDRHPNTGSTRRPSRAAGARTGSFRAHQLGQRAVPRRGSAHVPRGRRRGVLRRGEVRRVPGSPGVDRLGLEPQRGWGVRVAARRGDDQAEDAVRWLVRRGGCAAPAAGGRGSTSVRRVGHGVWRRLGPVPVRRLSP